MSEKLVNETLQETHMKAMLMAAEVADGIAPSDEWSEETKTTYYFAARDAARAIRKAAAISAPQGD